MKLAEARKLIDELVDSLVKLNATAIRPRYDSSVKEAFRSALAEAFEAGVRSPGLRFQQTAALRSACGCKDDK